MKNLTPSYLLVMLWLCLAQTPGIAAASAKPQEPEPGMAPPMPFVTPYGVPAFPGAWGGGMSQTETVGSLRPPLEAATTAQLGMIPVPEMGRIREDR